MRERRWASWVAIATVAAVATAGLAEPAQAAVPDRFGFALFSGGVVSEQFPPATTVTPGAPPGRWIVRFPGQGIVGGVVHVTAVHNAVAAPPGRWCQADTWGPAGADEIVRVSCYAPGGALDPTPGFSVLFTRSSGVFAGSGLYGNVDSTGAGAIVSQYNSVGALNTVAHVGVGLYSVFFPGLGTPGPNDGHVQVTAVNPGVGARCKVAAWASSPNGQSLRIMCFNSAGALADNRFTVSYQFRRSLYGPALPPGRFGYLWNVPPLGPPPTVFGTGGAPTLVGGPPAWGATFPLIFASPGTMQVTAFGANNFFCGLVTPWLSAGGNVIARIGCYTNAGAPVNTGFFAGYSSRF
jgi:hypothetical protein